VVCEAKGVGGSAQFGWLVTCSGCNPSRGCCALELLAETLPLKTGDKSVIQHFSPQAGSSQYSNSTQNIATPNTAYGEAKARKDLRITGEQICDTLKFIYTSSPLQTKKGCVCLRSLLSRRQDFRCHREMIKPRRLGASTGDPSSLTNISS